MTTDQLVERHTLEDVDESLMQFQRTMEEAAKSGALGPEQLQRFVATIRDAAARVNAEVLPQIDADSANEISQRLISVLTLDPSKYDVLDAADEYLIELEAIRHVLRDLLQEQHPQALRREARETIALLEEWLPNVAVSEVAELLGLSVRQLQRRRHDRGPATSREQLVARLAAILRHAWTDAGVVAWFHRPRHDLDGHSPIELLADPDRERDLLVAARSGRVQGGV
jgi:uncharacterized protein (DUF2384 family)